MGQEEGPLLSWLYDSTIWEHGNNSDTGVLLQRQQSGLWRDGEAMMFFRNSRCDSASIQDLQSPSITVND